MNLRGKKTNKNIEDLLFSEIGNYSNLFSKKYKDISTSADELYKDWHNSKYLNQCYYNLQEKYDCGLIPFSSYGKISSVCHSEGII